MTSMEHRPARWLQSIPTEAAHAKTCRGHPADGTFTPWTAKTLRPASLNQKIEAGFIRSEHAFKLNLSFRVFHPLKSTSSGWFIQGDTPEIFNSLELHYRRY